VNEKAGLPWTCLDYRHTFGNQPAMKGESLYKIGTLMGNSLEICRRHYAALQPEALADTVEFNPGPVLPVPNPLLKQGGLPTSHLTHTSSQCILSIG
jgi:hypothetical protein